VGGVCYPARYDRAQQLPGPRVWAVLRRGRGQAREFKFHLSNAPLACKRHDLAQMSGWRRPIETTFGEAKGEVGMDLKRRAAGWAGIIKWCNRTWPIC